MILGAWQVLVLVGAGAAYHAFVKKGEGAVFTLLATTGIFGVCGLGALSLETAYTTSNEWGITILFIVVASVAAIAFPVALTKSGPYAEDGDDPEGDDPEIGEPDSSFLGGIARRLT